jgi:solute carrier family 26 (sodium-independent sulfate anion transporter), member 11
MGTFPGRLLVPLPAPPLDQASLCTLVHTMSQRFGYYARKFLDIPQAEETERDRITRGESITSSVSILLPSSIRHCDNVDGLALQYTLDAYIEPTPTVKQWIQDATPTRADVSQYLKALVPWSVAVDYSRMYRRTDSLSSIEWLPRYNRVWFLGDLVAGVTVGAVVVPQGGSPPNTQLSHRSF